MGKIFDPTKISVLPEKVGCCFSGAFCIWIMFMLQQYEHSIIIWYLLHHIVSAPVAVALFSDSSLQISIYGYCNTSQSKNACSLYATTPNVQPISQATRPSRLGPQQNLKSFRGLFHGWASALTPQQPPEPPPPQQPQQPPPPQVHLQIAYEAHQAFSDVFLRFPAPQTCARCTFYPFSHSFRV